ncbi:MAG TPA: efflux RND transporter periplasmic adaptor subunit [Anaerohalosphaeraceae bacterium]|nr:efflux RND transporter periplasmic adaptor subunit [Anaerohalosphaeraceae bacterium]
MKKLISFLLLAALAGILLWFVYKRVTVQAAPQQGPMGMAPVVVVQTPVVQDVQTYYEFTGNTNAIEQVDIRARVKGYLKSVDYVDGKEVKAGDLLFTIESDEYLARRDQVKAQLAVAESELQRTQLDYERVEKAVQVNAVSRQDLTTREAEFHQAQARVLAAKASLQTAELDLGYTHITSPISGRVSRRLVDVGNLVGAGESTLLATVIRMDPMYVYFNAGEDVYHEFFLKYHSEVKQGYRPKFEIGLPGQEGYTYEGVLDYIDNKADSMTGTVSVRGQVANTEKHLLPGMFVRIRVPAEMKTNAVLVEERAVNSDIGGKYILTINARNIVEYNPVKLGPKVGDRIVIESGLNKDQTYIVSGFHLIRPGAPVTPQRVGQAAPAAVEKEPDSPASANQKP